MQRQKEWSVQGKAKVKRSGETDKFIRHFNTASSEKLAAKAKISERALERLERVDKPWEGWELRMQLAPDRPQRRRRRPARRRGRASGARSGSVRSTSRSAGRSAIAILGPNGSGKTTLLHALLGDVPLAEGRRWVGPGVTIGTMDQARAGFAADAVLLDAFTALTGLDATAARSLLAKFALGADHVGRRVGEPVTGGAQPRRARGADGHRA